LFTTVDPPHHPTAKYSNKSDSVYAQNRHNSPQQQQQTPTLSTVVAASQLTAAHPLPRISASFGRAEKGLLKSSSPLSSSHSQQVRIL
jgi:hypothetical protein